MYVNISDRETRKLITRVPVVLGRVDNGTVEQVEILDEAWLSAVEDSLVEAGSRDKYILELSR